MDVGIALVEAFLRVNGYLTVTEYPVIAQTRQGDHRAVTDLDVLAFRFPKACRVLPHEGRGPRADEEIAAADPALGMPTDAPDMIIGEVKTGRAELNRGATDPAVLRSALMRFGCCDRRATDGIVKTLLRRGEALTPDGHHVRLVAFGALPPEHRTPCRVVLLRDVTEFLRSYIRLHWTVLRHAECKDPAFNFLMMLEKAAALSGA